MIFKSNFPDIDIKKIGIYQFITSNPYGIKDDKVIFIDGITDKKLTFGQLKTNSKKLASGLKNIGFEHGDVLAICSHNHIDYPVVIFGAIAAGGIVTTVNPNDKFEEFASQLKDCGASVIICHPDYLKKTITAAKIANIHESKILLFDENEINDFPPFLSLSLFSNQEINPVEYTPEKAESTTAYLCYSSGTTGKSKGIEITHFNMVSNLTQINVFEDQINHENIFMGSHGASCVILCKFKFKLETFCRIIQDCKVNIAPIVPPIIWLLVNKINLIKERKYDLSSLKLIISSAAPLSGDLCKEFVETYNVPIKQAYGLTEATPFATATKTHEIVDAYVELKPDKIQSDQLKEEIKDFVSQKVAPHKKLHCVHFIDKIPKSSAGKTLRRSLRAKNECVKQCLL
ncbi:acetyl-CoA synthetase-like protein [Rhizophagus irregularis]|uniref:Acetyl-CoA synthetase-like protein n=1 Tax=Rhizophagus irregularis TaxID=588596 RepID=A0A2I1GCU8_9GLOM|nr:acetyl-CoA synthetase-like protein [Rhizophagus irregularis]